MRDLPLKNKNKLPEGVTVVCAGDVHAGRFEEHLPDSFFNFGAEYYHLEQRWPRRDFFDHHYPIWDGVTKHEQTPPKGREQNQHNRIQALNKKSFR